VWAQSNKIRQRGPSGFRGKNKEKENNKMNIKFDEAEKQKIKFAAHYSQETNTMKGVKKDLSYLLTDNEPELQEGITVTVDGEKILVGVKYSKQLTFTVIG
jgi:hypothetical protein